MYTIEWWVNILWLISERNRHFLWFELWYWCVIEFMLRNSFEEVWIICVRSFCSCLIAYIEPGCYVFYGFLALYIVDWYTDYYIIAHKVMLFLEGDTSSARSLFKAHKAPYFPCYFFAYWTWLRGLPELITVIFWYPRKEDRLSKGCSGYIKSESLVSVKQSKDLILYANLSCSPLNRHARWDEVWQDNSEWVAILTWLRWPIRELLDNCLEIYYFLRYIVKNCWFIYSLQRKAHVLSTKQSNFHVLN